MKVSNDEYKEALAQAGMILGFSIHGDVKVTKDVEDLLKELQDALANALSDETGQNEPAKHQIE